MEIYDLEKFELLLKDQALFFCRSDKFSDPFEASIPRRESEYRIHESIRIAKFMNHPTTIEIAKSKSDDMAELHKKFKRSFIVNCWHISTDESDAMWRLYLKTNEGVAIQSTYTKLYDSLKHNSYGIFISKVRYLDYDKDIWHHAIDYPARSYNLYTPIVHKRIEFKHESELRVFQQIDEAVENSEYWGNKLGENVSCKMDVLIEKIILPPTAEDDVEIKVKAIMEKYSCNVEVLKSKLAEPPIY